MVGTVGVFKFTVWMVGRVVNGCMVTGAYSLDGDGRAFSTVGMVWIIVKVVGWRSLDDRLGLAGGVGRRF